MIRLISIPSPADVPWDPSWWPRDGHSLPMEVIGYIFAALGAAALGWFLWLRLRAGWDAARPLRLFRQVCRDAGLTPSQTWWLWRVARHQRLSTPLTLLLSSATYDHHMQQFVSDRPGLDEQAPPRPLVQARQHLFEDSQKQAARSAEQTAGSHRAI